MKLTEELIKAQSREATRVANECSLYLDEESYFNGGLWVFGKMKEELRDNFFNGLSIGFLIGGAFAFLFIEIINKN